MMLWECGWEPLPSPDHCDIWLQALALVYESKTPVTRGIQQKPFAWLCQGCY